MTEIRVQIEPDFPTEFEVDRLDGREKMRGKKREKRKNGKSRRKRPPEAREGLGRPSEVREASACFDGERLPESDL